MSTADAAVAAPVGRPGDAIYRAATRTFNLAARVEPDYAVVARSVADVVDAVSRARRTGRPIRTMSTGHGATAQPPSTGTLLVRAEISDGVHVNPGSRTAVVPAGATWNDVVTAASEHGLVALHGSAGTVGVIGYLLRGGVSFYGRRFGLGVNSLRSITLVLADGTIAVASADRDPDLFWALRGGGGGFGIVIEVEIDLYPMSGIVTGATIWDAADAEFIAPLWARWTHDAPAEVSTSLRLMNLPPLPGVPEFLTAGQILVLDGAVAIETPADTGKGQAFADDLLAPLRSISKPIADTWHTGRSTDLLQTHMDPPDPLPYAGNHILLRELGDDGVDRFVTSAGPDSGPPLMIAELRQLGGALATPPGDGGVLSHTSARYAHIAIGAVIPPRTAEVVRDQLSRVATALAPWDTGFTVPSVVEHHGAPQRTFDDDTVAAVDVVRGRVDPDGLFRRDVDPIHDRPTLPE